MTSFIDDYLREAGEIILRLDRPAIDRMIDLLCQTRAEAGRLFILGVGGSAANASHAVNDFRKIVGIEAYAPTDNVSELTARTNDEGWAGVFEAWLRVSRLTRPRRCCSSFRSAAETWSTTSARTWSPLCNMQNSSVRGSWASSGATEVSRLAWRTPA